MSRIQLLIACNNVMRPHDGVRMHRHNFYQLVYIEVGLLYINVEDDFYLCKEGECALIPAGKPHLILNPGETDLEFHELKFLVQDPDLDASLASDKIKIFEDEFSISLIKTAVGEYLDCCKDKEKSAAALTESLVYHITKPQRIHKAPIGSFLQNLSAYSEVTRQIITYLSENYAKQISLSDISEYIGLNRNYICNCFNNDTGSTIMTCLAMIRIREAASLLLLSPGVPLERIAQRSGFGTINNMERTFKRYTLQTPTQFQTNNNYSCLTDSWDFNNLPLRNKNLDGGGVLIPSII